MSINYQNSDKRSDEKVNINADQPEVGRGTRWFQTFPPQACLSGGLVVVLPMCVGILVIILLVKHQTIVASTELILPSDTDDQEFGIPAVYPVDPNETITLSEKLYIVPRREWLGQPPTEALTLLELPVPYVIIMHTATENCSHQATCAFHVRQVQNFQIDSREWVDIGYNFLVGGDGNAYEGRGWKYVGAQVYGYNTKCIGIAFIGTFNQIMPPERQIVAAKQLIEIGVEGGYIAEDYKVLAARQLQTTQSPGLLLYEDVKKWPHWSEKP